MKSALAFVITCFFVSAAGAQSVENPTPELQFLTADDKDLSEFLWKKRPVVVFGDADDDPRFLEQIALLKKREADLAERDVVVITDTDPAQRTPLRLKLRPRGFMLVIVGKDGGVKLRKPFPWDVREISRSIDKMPSRQREIRASKEAG
ncbi:MAG: DUF4174 domain-containing protein [Sulfitobacter sp.]